MTVDTSREAVEDLIADLLKPSGVDLQVAIEQATDALAALLDERDELRQALFDCYQATGADTDGADAREMAQSWKPYPRLVVEEVTRLRLEADDDTENDALAALMDERDGAVRLRLTINGRLEQRIRDLEVGLKTEIEMRDKGWREADKHWARAERAEAKLAAVKEARGDFAISLIHPIAHMWDRGYNAALRQAIGKLNAILADTDERAKP